jgi:omega-amidase
MSHLTISLIQSDLYWEDKARNLAQFEAKIAALPKSAQVVILPEMFATGFSMQPELLGEPMEGATMLWLQKMALTYRKIITGSVIITEAGKYYNRLIWMQPDGNYYHYDKRHLFGFAGEDKHYSNHDKRLIVQVNGWKVCLMICYDLRFPVWSRQGPDPYDLLIYVANWPEKRNLAWKTLLPARAIENLCYVAGVNRIGTDGNGIAHSGDTSLIDPLGHVIWQQSGGVGSYTHTLDKEALLRTRAQFPFLNDADRFVLL